jgi:hypothetical protein
MPRKGLRFAMYCVGRELMIRHQNRRKRSRECGSPLFLDASTKNQAIVKTLSDSAALFSPLAPRMCAKATFSVVLLLLEGEVKRCKHAEDNVFACDCVGRYAIWLRLLAPWSASRKHPFGHGRICQRPRDKRLVRPADVVDLNAYAFIELYDCCAHRYGGRKAIRGRTSRHVQALRVQGRGGWEHGE